MKDQLDEYVKEKGLAADYTMLLDTDDYYVVLRVKHNERHNYTGPYQPVMQLPEPKTDYIITISPNTGIV